jgi:hypothetical protein
MMDTLLNLDFWRLMELDAAARRWFTSPRIFSRPTWKILAILGSCERTLAIAKRFNEAVFCLTG